MVDKFLEDATALAETREELMSLVEKITSATVNRTSSSLTHSEVLGELNLVAVPSPIFLC